MTRWAPQSRDVLRLVAVGLDGRREPGPDQWSGSRVVVTALGVAAALRDELSWPPDAERIVKGFAETEHGRCVVYDGGHIIKWPPLTRTSCTS